MGSIIQQIAWRAESFRSTGPLRSGVPFESPNNLLQRSGHDKVHAPDRLVGLEIGGSAPQVRRAAAERDRYAPL